MTKETFEKAKELDIEIQKIEPNIELIDGFTSAHPYSYSLESSTVSVTIFDNYANTLTLKEIPIKFLDTLREDMRKRKEEAQKELDSL